MNWLEFLTTYRIDYVTSGPNTRHGEVSIQCPFCGADDPSQHMGIALDKEAWGCHRNASHRGKAPFRLVQAVLGCSFNQAKLIVGQYNRADPDNFDDVLKLMTEEDDNYKVKEDEPLLRSILDSFREIEGQGSTKRFHDYLANRGFDNVPVLCAYYDLVCATTGRYKDRIIIPTYRDGTLLALTGRAITPVSHAPRYLSSSGAIKTTVFQESDIMQGGHVLFVVEGPFDALKMDYYGHEMGARTTCVFGTSVTIDQLSILKRASKKFNRTILLLDQDAIEQMFNLSDWLPHAEVGHLPYGVKDPGDLSKDQVKELVGRYL